MHHLEEDHQMYYCQQVGYWNGTLIRLRTIGTDENDTSTEQTCELKIYNK